MVVPEDFFRTCNVLPISCTHLALWKGKVKDPRLGGVKSLVSRYIEGYSVLS